jgi:hypothetical protein
VNTLLRAAGEGRLKCAEIFLFTDKQAAGGDYYRGTSPSWALFELAVAPYKLQMKYDLVWRVIWIAGTQLIHQESDGLSRGGRGGPATQRLSLIGIVQLHLGTLEQSWSGVVNLEII